MLNTLKKFFLFFQLAALQAVINTFYNTELQTE